MQYYTYPYLISFLAMIIVSNATCQDEQKKIIEDWRPIYHFVPPSGWMNDPNGLIWFNGYYHLFYQHNPYAPFAYLHNISWGHARSRDLLEWENLPVALSPSLPEEEWGCFSGCAVNVNGTLNLIYTCNSNSSQVQCLASSSDTINFIKYGQILSSPIDDGGHFRDPKVWSENGSWYMLVSSFQERRGQYLLFKSVDLRRWSYEGILVQENEYFDHEWECPDFFQLGDKRILLVSMQDHNKLTRGYKNRDYGRTGYMVGVWKAASRKFIIKQDFIQIDNGHDFYAAQTWKAPDGRHIIIAWFGFPTYFPPEEKYNWAGMMTIPRELSLSKRGTMNVVPIREIEKLRVNPPLEYGQKILNDEYLKLFDHVQAVEVSMTWNLSDSNAEKYGLRLGDEEYADGGLYLYVDTQSERLTLDRRYPRNKISGYRSIPLPADTLLSLRVYFDKSSVEVFVNEGETSMSSRIYPADNQRFLSAFAENGAATFELCRLWELQRPQERAGT